MTKKINRVLDKHGNWRIITDYQPVEEKDEEDENPQGVITSKDVGKKRG